MGSFAADVPVWLEDTKENLFQDLRQNETYVFTASPIDETGRFVVHFSNPLGINNQNALDMVKIYAYEKTVYVDIPETLGMDAHCMVFNMIGNKVVNQEVTEGLNAIPAPFNEGYYLVTVNTGRGMVTEKVFIK